MLGAVEQDITAIGGDFSGSPGYIAPEAFAGGESGTSGDIYSFGTVLFEMIAGRPPFDEQSKLFALIRAKTDEDAPPITRFRPDVPEMLAERIAGALSRRATERPPSANAVISGLESCFQQL